MGRLIYEIIFYEDSQKEIPLICKIRDSVQCKNMKVCKAYTQNVDLDVIQMGECDNFVKNTDKLLIVDEKTKSILENLNIDNVQYIPAQLNGMTYYIINILTLLHGSLDMKNSRYMIFPDDFPNMKVRGKIGTIWSIVLLKRKIDKHIFRIEEYSNTIFVDDYLKSAIEQYGLSGLDFHRVDLS